MNCLKECIRQIGTRIANMLVSHFISSVGRTGSELFVRSKSDQKMSKFEDIRYGVKKLFGLNRGGRNFAVYPDDRFLVSYPRSGNTWTRFLIANLVYPQRNVSFLNIEELIPDSSSQSNRAL